VLLRPKFQKYITPAEVRDVIRELMDLAELIQPTQTITACRDPDDDHILSLAVDGRADAVVTGDDDLLVLHPFRGIPILTARAYLDRHAGA